MLLFLIKLQTASYFVYLPRGRQCMIFISHVFFFPPSNRLSATKRRHALDIIGHCVYNLMFIRFQSRLVRQWNGHVKHGLWRKKDKACFQSGRCAVYPTTRCICSQKSSGKEEGRKKEKKKKHTKQPPSVLLSISQEQSFLIQYTPPLPFAKRLQNTDATLSAPSVWPLTPRVRLSINQKQRLAESRPSNNGLRLSLGKRDPLKFNLAKLFLLKTSKSASHQNCRSERGSGPGLTEARGLMREEINTSFTVPAETASP